PSFEALGPVTFMGSSIFSRGTLTGPGGFTVAGDAELALAPIGFGVHRILDKTSLRNDGIVNADLPLQFRNGAVVENHGTWRVRATLGHANPSNADGVFSNASMLIRDSGGTVNCLVPLDNNGDMIRVINDGTL